MEIQLQELIDQIKKDGVQAAEVQAEAILNEAKADAEKIVADAQARAKEILNEAKAEQERMVKSGEDALRQAGRNLLLSFRESVTRELDVLLNENVTAAYSSERFAQLLLTVVESWAKTPSAEAPTVLLNEKDLKALEEILLAGLKEKAVEGVTLKASERFDGGFRISVQDGSVYYDYSTQAVVEMLSNYLSPKVTELLREA